MGTHLNYNTNCNGKTEIKKEKVMQFSRTQIMKMLVEVTNKFIMMLVLPPAEQVRNFEISNKIIYKISSLNWYKQLAWNISNIHSTGRPCLTTDVNALENLSDGQPCL
jgi:hypothetical protein